jgi:hypothetical protein
MAKRKSRVWKRGPFTLYRCAEAGTLDISITALSKWPFGWEWGYKDAMRGQDKPLVEFRVGKLTVLYFEKFKGGFELWLLGFWLIR